MHGTLLRSGQGLMLAVLLAASGGHWMILQSLAWTRMLVCYSQSENIVSAVAKTFDGQHPCSLCKKIEQAKNTEPSPEVLQLEVKASFLIPSRISVVRASGVSWEVEVPWKRLESRFEEPSAPPPRGVAS